jgi:hypothetical protein
MDDDTTRRGRPGGDPGATGPMWPLPDEESTSVLPPGRPAASHGVDPTRVAPDGARDWLNEPLPEQPARTRAGRPRPTRSGPSWPRFVAPVVLLVAVVAVVTLSVHSGVLRHGAKTGAGHPAAAVSHTPKAKYVYYRVRKGDTMSLIAGKYHITLGQLLVLNPRASVSTIAVGQKLKVPNIR